MREAVSSPETVEESVSTRKNAFRQVGRKRLKVTFRMEGGVIIIITVVDRNR